MSDFSRLFGRLTAGAGLFIALMFSSSPQLFAQERTESMAPDVSPFQNVDVLALSRPTPADPHRPSPLVPLYVSFGVMQALDFHSTQRALDGGGGREANPVAAAVLGSPLAMVALKAGATTGVVILSEKLRKRHPLAAVATMVALNSAYAIVVSRNYLIARER